MPLRLYNTIARSIEPFVPANPAQVTFYSCGPTVYDDAHIGNFRSFLAADVLRRWLESPLCEVTTAAGKAAPGPRRVTHVMNITDVGHMTDDASLDGGGEDKMQAAARRLAEAKKSGKLPPDARIDPNDPYAIADFYANRFLEDARTLGLKLVREADEDPSLMPRPTQLIPDMIAMVQALLRGGHAYAVGERGAQTVYFDVQSFPQYGLLSGNTLEHLRSGAGGRIAEANQQQKKHPADFLLWKADPAHIMKWDSPWGAGYPGWHLECSVMARRRLGDEIDLHSGGEDNIFPHHECEIAQSCSATGRDHFARMWFHPRFLLVEGEKMAKSKGNFFTPRDLFEKGYEPAAIRLELIKTHYRSNANFTEQGLKDSQRMVERWRTAVSMIHDFNVSSAADQISADDVQVFEEDSVARFASALNDDLNVAEAIARFHRGVQWFTSRWQGGGASGAFESANTEKVRALLAGEAPPRNALFDRIFSAIRTMSAVLGVLELAKPAIAETTIGIFADGLAPDAAVIAKLEDRRAARAAKDYARSDAIRDELAAMGYAIKDVAGGKVEVRRG